MLDRLAASLQRAALGQHTNEDHARMILDSVMWFPVERKGQSSFCVRIESDTQKDLITRALNSLEIKFTTKRSSAVAYDEVINIEAEENKEKIQGIRIFNDNERLRNNGKFIETETEQRVAVINFISGLEPEFIAGEDRYNNEATKVILHLDEAEIGLLRRHLNAIGIPQLGHLDTGSSNGKLTASIDNPEHAAKLERVIATYLIGEKAANAARKMPETVIPANLPTRTL